MDRSGAGAGRYVVSGTGGRQGGSADALWRIQPVQRAVARTTDPWLPPQKLPQPVEQSTINSPLSSSVGLRCGGQRRGRPGRDLH